MSLSVIIGFVACWLPYFVVSLVRIFSDYCVRVPGLLSASELLALAHSALNPLIYGLFSARTLRHSCGQRCRRRRSHERRTPSRGCGRLSTCCCCCCCGQMVADVSPDAVVGADPSPLSPATANLHQPPIELRDLALAASTAARSRQRNSTAADGRPSADSSTTDTTTADDVCRRTSASAELQRGGGGTASTHRVRSRRAHLQSTQHGTDARTTADITDHHVPASDPIVRTVTVPPPSASINKRQSR